MIVFLFGVFGLIIGSFLNVVIYRFRDGESGIVAGRSHCRTCKWELSWSDNIPLVSFIILRGKCRQCHEKISWQYPLVEAACALAFVLAISGAIQVYGGVNPLNIAIGALIAGIFGAMIVVFVYDIKYMEVPMVAIWFAVFLSIMIIILRDFFVVEEFIFLKSTLLNNAIAGALCFLFFFSLSYASQERWMGYGDGFIALVIGLFLGPLASVIGLLLAIWSGAAIGIMLMVIRSKTSKSVIPFGPFLVGGMFVSFAIAAFAPQWMQVLW